MKQCYLLIVSLLSFFLIGSTWGQSAGDIAFVGYNADGNDEFAFMTLVDIPANTSIWFTDNEWDGTDRFNNINEGELEWNHTAILPAGSIVVIAGNSGAAATIVSGLGTVSGNGLNLGASNETLYALLSEPIANAAMISPDFLAGISNDLSGDGVGLLTNTGLTNGINFIDFDNDQDGFKYTGVTFGQTNFSDFLALIMNTSNWQMESSDGNLVLDGGTFAIDDLSTINLTWNGSAGDNSWSNMNNWTPANVPVSTSDISIPSGLTSYPTISSTVTVKGITLESGTSLIANATVTGPSTYKRNLPTTNWYLVSSPVAGETIENFIGNTSLATGTGTNIGLAPYDTSTGSWDYQEATSTGTFNNGQGYSIKSSASGDIAFTGTLNTTNVSFGITTGGTSNFNLIGNPFTAHINSDTFTNSNIGALTEGTVWLWDGSQYVTYNTASPINIAPGQGFFIEAANNTNVVFSTFNQSHQSFDTFMKQEPTSNLELFIESGDAKQSTKVFYISDKTTGFDNGYDSKIFGGAAHDFTVFTELVANNEGKKLAIQTLPNNNYETMVIPVGIIADAGKEITFSVQSLNLPENINVFLEDRINGEFINLSENSYKTTLIEASNSVGQFYVHTTSEKLSTENLDQNLTNISIYKSAKQEITITGLQSNANITVFSILGKKAFTTDIISNGNSKVTLPALANGVYIVKLTSENGRKTKKIILD